MCFLTMYCTVVVFAQGPHAYCLINYLLDATSQVVDSTMGGSPRVVVSTAALHARARGSVPGLGGLKETKNVSSPFTCESQYCGEPP